MAASPSFPKVPSHWISETHLLEKDLFLRLWKKNESELQRDPHKRKGRFLYIVHGQAEQSDRYEHFPFFLDSAIDAIACIDLPGHGKSAGSRGHISHFNEYVEAVIAGYNKSRDLLNGSSLSHHWFGHSLGGLISFVTLQMHRDLPLKSVALSAPFFDLAFPPPPIKVKLAQMIAPFLPSLPLYNELKPQSLSHDPSVVAWSNKNPLDHKRITPKAFMEMQRVTAEARTTGKEFPYNILFEVPLADPICSWKASVERFSSLKIADGKKKELTTFPGFYHESFNEIGKERAFLALESFILKYG